MKKKIFSVVMILTMVASFLAPFLTLNNAFAVDLEYYCTGTLHGHYRDGICTVPDSYAQKCAEDGGQYNGSGGCIYRLSPSEDSGSYNDGTEDHGTNSSTYDTSNDSSQNSRQSGSSTSGSSNATTVGELSTPDKLQKTCGEGQVYTSILGGEGCQDVGEQGEGIFKILNIVLTVLTYGVGIAGTLGIVISGVQYLTARDNEAQLVKAKSRLINIVIGLAAYAVMWGFLQWIIPGGILNGN